jgi:histidine triad (HIT) family protein
MSDCIFCRIAAGDIPAEVVAQDDDFVAFADLHPLGPVHVLIVPRRHVASMAELGELPSEVVAGLLPFAARVAREAGVEESGYRLLTNTGPDAGQEVLHLHWHVIGGRPLGGMA